MIFILEEYDIVLYHDAYSLADVTQKRFYIFYDAISLCEMCIVSVAVCKTVKRID